MALADAPPAPDVAALLASGGVPVAACQALADALVVVAGRDEQATATAVESLRAEHVGATILVLVAGGAPARTAALVAGADDALSRPVAAAELAVRIRARGRRRRASVAPGVERLGRLELDRAGALLRIDGVAVVARPKELHLLGLLLEHRSRPVDRGGLAAGIWGDALAAPDSNALDVHVSRLRRLVEPAGIRIVAEAGYGYRIEPAPDA